MHRRIVAAVLFSIASIGISSSTAADGFFTGRRGDAIALLRQANAINTSADDAMKLVRRAEALNDGIDDPYVDIAIEETLTRLYTAAGDSEAAASHAATGFETSSEVLLKDGFAQAVYTILLMGFDLQIPLDANEQVDVVGQLDSMIEELDALDGDDPQNQREMERFKAALKGFRDGALQRNVTMLKRARRDILSQIDELARRHADPEADAAEKKLMRLMRENMSAMFDLVIADTSRDRRGFERAARKVGSILDELAQMTAADAQ